MEQAKKSEVSGVVENSEPLKTEKASRGFFWFVAEGSLLKGPYSTNELKKLIDKKEISEKFFAWRDGYKEWRPIYGIEEFKNAEIKDFAYPSVPVPGAPSVANSSPEQLIPKHAPIYRVRFNQSRWNDLKKTEIVFLFLGSLLFTFAILNLALKVFEHEWEKVWGKRVSQMLYVVGREAEAVPLYMLAPLHSAPGLQYQESHFVAADIEADMDRHDPTRFSGFKIESQKPKEAYENLFWDKSNTYNRRMRVQGYYDLKNPAIIHVHTPGSPYEPVSSGRLTEGFSHP